MIAIINRTPLHILIGEGFVALMLVFGTLFIAELTSDRAALDLSTAHLEASGGVSPTSPLAREVTK